MAKEKKCCAKRCAKKAVEQPKVEKKVEKPVQKPFTKAQIVSVLAEKAGLSKKDATACVDNLVELVRAGLQEADSFTLPGLFKIEKQWVEAKEGKKGVPDPFHPGATVDRPDKPAHWKIKVKTLKALKDVAEGLEP